MSEIKLFRFIPLSQKKQLTDLVAYLRKELPSLSHIFLHNTHRSGFLFTSLPPGGRIHLLVVVKAFAPGVREQNRIARAVRNYLKENIQTDTPRLTILDEESFIVCTEIGGNSIHDAVVHGWILYDAEVHGDEGTAFSFNINPKEQ